MINNKTLVLLCIALLLGGFVFKAQAEAGSGDDKQATRATPPAGSALIYIYRDEDPPVEAAAPVVLDGRRIGQTGPRTYLLATVSPGTHFLISGDKVIANLSVECQAGKTYFISQKVLSGTYPVRTRLAVADPVSARRSIDRSKPVASDIATPSATPRPAVSAAPASPAPSSPERDGGSKPVSASKKKSGGLALIVKSGRFDMSDRTQTIGGLQSEFDSKASGVVGAELEWRDRNGLAFGGELYRYTNKIAAVGTSLSGDMEAVALMANAKKYFEMTELLYPYIGAGLGIATNSFSGDITGSASGPAYQAMAGIEFRMQSVGIYTELKYLSSSTKDSANETTKIGGSGKNIGLGISFGF